MSHPLMGCLGVIALIVLNAAVIVFTAARREQVSILSRKFWL